MIEIARSIDKVKCVTLRSVSHEKVLDPCYTDLPPHCAENIECYYHFFASCRFTNHCIRDDPAVSRVLISRFFFFKQIQSTCRVYKTKCQKLTDEMTELRTQLRDTISRKEAEKYEQLASVSVTLVDYVKCAENGAAKDCAEQEAAKDCAGPPIIDLTEFTDDEQTAVEDQMKRLADQV